MHFYVQRIESWWSQFWKFKSEWWIDLGTVNYTDCVYKVNTVIRSTTLCAIGSGLWLCAEFGGRGALQSKNQLHRSVCKITLLKVYDQKLYATHTGGPLPTLLVTYSSMKLMNLSSTGIHTQSIKVVLTALVEYQMTCMTCHKTMVSSFERLHSLWSRNRYGTFWESHCRCGGLPQACWWGCVDSSNVWRINRHATILSRVVWKACW